MKVNMTPNPLDVVTIHASQGDTEARQWEFELHNNGELIDTSEITEQLFFKSYKGGTEQILPENGSVPTTAPFLGDIRYPQGLLTDQEFLYRESPTVEDGLANIVGIKGQTLKWNQIFPTQTVNYSGTGYTLTSNNDGKFVLTVTETASQDSSINHAWLPSTTFTAGHKYVLLGSDTAHGIDIYIKGYYVNMNGIWAAPSAMGANVTFMFNNLAPGTYNLYPMIFDLTAMGLESITSVDEFTSLFPLNYYPYNSGSLIPFNGNGIKTVGFNQWDEEWEVGGINSSSGQPATANDRFRSKNFISLLPNVVYYAKIEGLTNNDFRMYYYDANKNFIGVGDWQYSGTFTTPNNVWFGKFVRVNKNTYTRGDICINISDPNRNGAYEPYTSSTLSLPISTYFPNGMNGFNGVYDELTSTKAITRYRRRVFNGTENWKMETLQGKTAFYIGLGDGMYNTWNSLKRYCVCDKFYGTPYNATQVGGRAYGQVALTGQGSDADFIADFQNVTEWKTWLSNNPTTFVYEAKTVTEVSFTTASLVTENTEIPLSNEDGVLIGKCTEQLSAEPGFHDAKIKLADADGECYSNKLQLHVERSPQ